VIATQEIDGYAGFVNGFIAPNIDSFNDVNDVYISPFRCFNESSSLNRFQQRYLLQIARAGKPRDRPDTNLTPPKNGTT